MNRFWLVGILALATATPAEAQALLSCDDGAIREGVVNVATTTEPLEASALLAGFAKACPGIRVIYQKMNSIDLYDRVVEARGVDVAWSSAPDLQIKLVNDGFARRHSSPDADGIPGWATWREEAFGTTAEAVTIVYNRELVGPSDVPHDHRDLMRLLLAQPDEFRGRVATYDPERSGSGFLFITQDVEATQHTWALVRALGQAKVKLYTSTDAMLDGVAAGELKLAYNVLGSYAAARAERDPALGVVVPDDYALVISRVAFIAAAAAHPHAADAFLAYLLSREGQARLALGFLHPVRDDVTSPAQLEAGPARRPVGLGTGLLTYLDQTKRAQFVKHWRRSLQGVITR